MKKLMDLNEVLNFNEILIGKNYKYICTKATMPLPKPQEDNERNEFIKKLFDC